MRIWRSTVKKLRMIYAMTGERMVSILDRIITVELERVEREEEECEKRKT